MKTILLSFTLLSLSFVTNAQRSSVLKSPKELKKTIGEFVTESNTEELQERSYKVTEYVASNGGTFTLLKFKAEEENAMIATSQPVKPQLSIAPNPNDGNFSLTILHPASTEMQVNIYNLLGAKVKAVKVTTTSTVDVRMQNQPNGIYFLQCIMEGEIITERIIKE